MENNKIEKDLELTIIQLNTLNAAHKQYEDQYNSMKAELSGKIQKLMGIKKIDAYDFVTKAGNIRKSFSVKDVRPKKVIFDVEALEKKLSKSILKKIVNKQYKINDIEGLVAYLKECGVDPVKFKSYIDVDKTVDQKQIDQLSAVGEITEKDIEGCFEVKFIQSYIKISEVEDEDDSGDEGLHF